MMEDIEIISESINTRRHHSKSKSTRKKGDKKTEPRKPPPPPPPPSQQQKPPPPKTSQQSPKKKKSKSKKEPKKKKDKVKVGELFEGIPDLSSKSVIAMGQSVGVELSKDVAYSLGKLAIEKLRAVTLLALEFSAHEKAPGLRVEDFKKAEEFVNCPSYGHGCPIGLAGKMIPIAGAEIVVIDEGPEINLQKTLAESKISEIAVEPLDPTLFVHYSLYDNDLTRSEDICGKNDFSVLNESQNLKDSTPENSDEMDWTSSASEGDRNKSRSNLREFEDDSSSSSFGDEDYENFEDEEIESQVLKIGDRLKAEGFRFKDGKEMGSSVMEISAHWQDFMKVLTKTFLRSAVDEQIEVDFEDSAETLKMKRKNSKEFLTLTTYIRTNGASPCLNVICDFLRDYLKGQLSPVTPKGLKLAVAIIDAFLGSPQKLNSLQMRKISSLLIEIVVSPAPCEVLNYLTNVFMKCLKLNDDLLTWTCSYITEVLKQLTISTYESLSKDLRLVFCGAICLANGLESVSIQVAQEFGWHTSIISFLQVWSKDLQSKSQTVLGEGGFVQEEILKFCRNFILKYETLVTPEELKTIRDLLNDIYGEKLLALLNPTELMSSLSKRNSKSQKSSYDYDELPFTSAAAGSDQAQEATEPPVIRRGFWKSKKVTLRYPTNNKERQGIPVFSQSNAQ